MIHRSIPAPYSFVLKYFAPPVISRAARTKIADLDLEPIKFKLVKEGGWSLENADRVAVLYKGFLTLHLCHPDDMHVPTDEIDAMWHAHILDTAKYMADCHALFGRYLHHFPYAGLRGADDEAQATQAFAATRARMMALCGLDPMAVEDIKAADCGGSSCSSSSCSSGGDSGGGGNGNGGNDGPGDGGTHKSSCTTYIPFNDPARGNTGDRKRRAPTPLPIPDERKPQRPLWRRILGLSGATAASPWAQSTDPAGKLAIAERPGRAALLLLADEDADRVTRH